MPIKSNAQSSVTIYGRVDSGLDVSKSNRGTLSRVVSGGVAGSRLGFQGSEDLGSGLRAVFRLESGFNIDDGMQGQGGRVFGREAWVGISSTTFGTVTLGRIGVPYFINQPFIDAFVWAGAGGIAALTRSTGAAQRQILTTAINARADNAVNYTPPTFNGLSMRVLASVGEGSPALGRSYGASFRYTGGRLDVLGAYNRQLGSNNSNGSVRAASVGGSYDFRVAKVYAGFTRESNDCRSCAVTPPGGASTAIFTLVPGAVDQDFRLINLGIRVPFGAFTAIAQAVRIQDRSNYTTNPGGRDGTWIAAGGEYALSKRTLLHASVGTIGNQHGSNYAIGSGSAQQAPGFVPSARRATTASFVMSHGF